MLLKQLGIFTFIFDISLILTHFKSAVYLFARCFVVGGGCFFVFKTLNLFSQCFREFLACCGKALDINDQLIKEDQRMYQEDMKEKYAHLKTQLAKYIGDEVCYLITIDQASSTSRREI